MSVFVKHIVCQFQFLKRHGLFLQLFSCVGGVWVHVKAGGEGRVGFPCHKPGRSVVGVTVALIVHRNNVHQHHVAPFRVDSSKGNPERWEHPSGKIIIIEIILFRYISLYGVKIKYSSIYLMTKYNHKSK